ncbi:MAG: hypothetical protein A3C08_01555 [Candidatus Taylorbacteria bacterium RIFCSPHIGHO2_02_FULL_47_18]|uniref:Uncharacterized protein n=1 Tax=Candidatus Taylorbacteria bacterium RIFCSPLOWO2_01_FULL_48_100 TaxID=1802322 RepID=A0A1G2NE67_9BACT|nr:MAG: hypothetical protein A2670_01435 [Candidatus Taylorbacteria bacterium RIFCSPHIGHO2_01_FULL_48_38]OHA28440.1 MAG: hypothetical protein A3C08_01555 [Candidatus Taylorbacteria bacterium RIFCSPHIGHO2_02_FULL_47_18]OHA34378.1 MAG: hypothetical protein A2938_00815 [Candidatus Taylorbacteria bacterium RIFCSPLOWO2_01_FULL_48_100]OHA40195.1 MAG: hypothetical protein A3J31_01265 [Candidatus Taylorbacteria bacterium RIFCSPLOWO2_02_FULL_48_16]OHA45470.1 MAG: hypothetical protein A3H13_01580 [Candid
MPLLTPKFLTKELVQAVVRETVNSVMLSTIGSKLKRRVCHIVILVPTIDNSADYPNFPAQAHVLYEHSVGKEIWSAKYDEIAQCKAQQLWHDRNDDITDVKPHLLFTGDTVYWGGVKRDGIVVACSGVQPWFDKMISGMIADVLIGLAYDAFMTRENPKEDFLD